jgi:tetratricopeptide (TPR) repeat protein
MKNFHPQFISIFLLLMFAGNNARSQDMIDFFSKEICNCLTGLQQINPQGNPREDMVSCFEDILKQNSEALEIIYGEGVITNDPEASKKIGEDIGKKLVKDCDIFIDLFVKENQNNNAKGVEYYRKGQEYLNEGELDKAISAFNEAIAFNSLIAEYFNMRGVAYFQKEDFYRAISDFYRAIEINPRIHISQHNLAYSKYQLGDYKLALVDVDAAIKIDPNYIESYNLQGLILNELGKPVEARSSFIQANQLDNKNSIYAYNIAYTYYDERNYPMALEWFLKVSNLGDNTLEVLGKIGNCYDILGNHPKAVEYHTKCLELDPKDYGVYFNRGLAFFNLEAFEDAKNDFLKAMDLSGEDVDVFNQLGKVYFELGNFEKAHEFVKKSMEMDSRNASYYDLRAAIYESQGKYELAIEDYTVSISLYPEDCEIHLALGKLFQNIQNTERSKMYFQNALEKGCDSARDYLDKFKD